MPTILDTFQVAADGPTFVNYALPPVTESFGATTTISATQKDTLLEQFSAISTTSADAYLRILEQFQAADSVTGSERRSIAVLERFEAGSTAAGSARLANILTETFVAVGSAPAVTQRVFAAESFSAGSIVTSGAAHQIVVTETFVAASASSGTEVQQVTVTEQFLALANYVIVPKAFIAEQFQAASTASAGVNESVTVGEIFSVSDTATPVAHIRVTNREQFFASTVASARGSFVLDDVEQVTTFDVTDVWTADTRSWGMSRYVDTPVTEFVNNQFGVGPEGVFAASDAAVTAYFETGDISLLTVGRDGRPDLRKKRLHYVYGYARQSTALQVRVSADVQGVRSTETYTQEDRSSDFTRGVRCQVGRGFASNYLRLRVGGAAVFDMAGLEAEVSATNRRI